MGGCLSRPAVAAPLSPKGAGDGAAAAAQAAPKAAAAAAAAADGAAAPKAAAAAAAHAGEHSGGNGSCCAAAEDADTCCGYLGAPTAVCELSRVNYLHDLQILDTKPERRFDDITKLCTLVFKVPIALVSLVDTPVQWFKSAQGVPGVESTPRNTSFCAWTLLPAYPEALVVEDAHQDARFKDNPLVVGAPFIRFYAGCPLVCSNGMRLGSLCIIDSEPRTFDANSCNLLANMAEMVTREIEKDKVLKEQRELRRQSEQRQLLRTIECFNDAIMLVHMETPSCGEWSIVFANEAWERLVNVERPNLAQSPLLMWDVFDMPSAGGSASSDGSGARFVSAIAGEDNFDMLLHTRAAGAPLAAQFRCSAHGGLAQALPIGIPNFLPDAARGDGGTFYFATLTPDAAPSSAGSSAPGSASGLASQLGSGQRHHSGLGALPRRLPARKASFSIMPSAEQPFPDVRLGPLLGKGAFGRVFRGTWAGRMVAVKIIEYTQQPGDPGPLEGLLSEQVSHPNVVTTYKHSTRALQMARDDDDADTDATDTPSSAGGSRPNSGQPSMRSFLRRPQVMEACLVLEFCNRGCVCEAVEKGWFRTERGGNGQDGGAGAGAPDMAAILPTAREMAAALCYLHHKGILHGDLTGNNVLLTAAPSEARGFTAKVSDFGLSRLVSSDAPVIETRTYGTVTHMPPELLLEGRMSRAVDVYSWGVIVWEMYVGRRPFFGLSHSQVLHAIARGQALQLPANMPPGFGRLLGACLSPDPARRPTFSDILDTLAALEAELPPQQQQEQG